MLEDLAGLHDADNGCLEIHLTVLVHGHVGVLHLLGSEVMAKHHVIIILKFYGTYILRNLSSEVQQNRIIKHNHKRGCTKVFIRTREN